MAEDRHICLTRLPLERYVLKEFVFQADAKPGIHSGQLVDKQLDGRTKKLPQRTTPHILLLRIEDRAGQMLHSFGLN